MRSNLMNGGRRSFVADSMDKTGVECDGLLKRQASCNVACKCTDFLKFFSFGIREDILLVSNSTNKITASFCLF